MSGLNKSRSVLYDLSKLLAEICEALFQISRKCVMKCDEISNLVVRIEVCIFNANKIKPPLFYIIEGPEKIRTKITNSVCIKKQKTET